VIIAALNLILNFDLVEKGVSAQAPKYMEWYGAFGIMVTLVWMYLEILRLLSKMRERQGCRSRPPKRKKEAALSRIAAASRGVL
jgi:hypothetical protein